MVEIIPPRQKIKLRLEPYKPAPEPPPRTCDLCLQEHGHWSFILSEVAQKLRPDFPNFCIYCMNRTMSRTPLRDADGGVDKFMCIAAAATLSALTKEIKHVRARARANAY